jgi:hypothetical protein
LGTAALEMPVIISSKHRIVTVYKTGKDGHVAMSDRRSPPEAQPAREGRRFTISELCRLVIYAGIVLLGPAIASHLMPDKRHFDLRPIAHLRAAKPKVVILSDSMVDNGIDPELLGKLLGNRSVELMWYGGAASASWYFRLKNYIIASGIQPELVCIFFRDWMLTDPHFRAEGSYRSQVEAAMHETEPVYERVMGRKRNGESEFQAWIDRIYPLDARRHVEHEKIDQAAARMVTSFGLRVTDLRHWVRDMFALAKLTGGGIEEAAGVSKEPEVEFDPDPARSFLPHMVREAADARIRLCFVRVKRYPGPDGRVPQSEQLRKYIAALNTWIESHGCYFVDDAENPERTADMYLPGNDHIGPWAKKRSTELYAAELRRFLP